MKMFLYLGAALALFVAAPALAQYAGGTPVNQSWFAIGTPINNWSIDTSGEVKVLPTGGNIAFVCNQGTVDFYATLGTSSSVTPTISGAGSAWVKNGTCKALNLHPFNTQYTYIGLITASSSSTARIEAGVGTPSEQ